MGSVVSKLSLYDILAMVIPGGTILLFLSSIMGFDLTFEHASVHSTFIWIAVFVLSYLLGLINHVLTAVIWSSFRNNIEVINQVKENGYSEYHNAMRRRYIFMAILIIACALINACLSKCSIPISEWIENNGCNACCFFALLSFLFIFALLLCPKENYTTSKESALEGYYKAYYAVAKNRYSDDIFIMEGQVAFIQNMLFPICLLLLLPGLGNICVAKWNCIRWFLAFGIIALIYVVFECQLKIYQRVWTDSEYLS